MSVFVFVVALIFFYIWTIVGRGPPLRSPRARGLASRPAGPAHDSLPSLCVPCAATVGTYRRKPPRQDQVRACARAIGNSRHSRHSEDQEPRAEIRKWNHPRPPSKPCASPKPLPGAPTTVSRAQPRGPHHTAPPRAGVGNPSTAPRLGRSRAWNPKIPAQTTPHLSE